MSHMYKDFPKNIFIFFQRVIIWINKYIIRNTMRSIIYPI